MDRMSPLDASFLHIEDAVSHMHIGSVAVFEGPPPTAHSEVSPAETPHAVSARGDGQVPATVEIPEPRNSDGGPRHRAD